ncbi:MAG: HAMP domain-containing sensor histidine kinase [Acidobacteriota bacterium]
MIQQTLDKETAIFNILNKIEVGILVLDKSENEIVFLNKYFIKLTDNNSQHIIKIILNSFDTEEIISTDNEIEIDGKLTYGYSYYQIEGQPDKFFVLITDISSKSVYMEIINDKNHYRKLSRFASEITHEAGNPLTSVIMTLQVLLGNMDQWEMDTNREYLKTSISELKRLSIFIKMVRDISVDQKIRLEETNLKQFIQMFIHQNKPELENKNIVIKENINENITVMVDQEVFIKVINDLTQIILKFNPEETQNIIIEVNEVSHFFLKLVFENNGTVIPEDIREKIFLPIISNNPDEHETSLYFSQKQMIKMGGTIKQEKKENGAGERFAVYIPISV